MIYETLVKMTKKMARAIVGGLSNPSKMPGFSYGLPAKECKVGGKLRKIANSVCSFCYAHKGMYVFPVVQEAQYRRLESLNHPLWVDAMVTLITGQEVFRWHDSGDLQSLAHLVRIIEVCKRTSLTKHWIPTKEKAIVAEYRRLYGDFPANVVVRVSSPMVNMRLMPTATITHTSSVHTAEPTFGSVVCDAYTRDGKCDTCRKCWNRDIIDISYPKH